MTESLAALDRRITALLAALEPAPGEDPLVAAMTGIASLKSLLAAQELELFGLRVEDAWVKEVSGAIQDAAERAIGEIKGRGIRP